MSVLGGYVCVCECVVHHRIKLNLINEYQVHPHYRTIGNTQEGEGMILEG